MELNREQLKLEAYKQEVNRLQEANADFRVEITLLSKQLQEANETIQKTYAQLEAAKQHLDEETIKEIDNATVETF